MAPHSSTLAWKIHGRRSLVGCSPWSCEELDTTERLHFHFSLSCIGEGNGNPLQCPCLENPRDWGAWWAAIYGVAQSWTRLKRLSSSSSSTVTLLSSPYNITAVKTVMNCPEYKNIYGICIQSQAKKCLISSKLRPDSFSYKATFSKSQFEYDKHKQSLGFQVTYNLHPLIPQFIQKENIQVTVTSYFQCLLCLSILICLYPMQCFSRAVVLMKMSFLILTSHPW